MCLIKWPPNLKTIGSSLELHPWRSSDKPGTHTYQDDTKETGTIVQELQSGYTISGDRVLREAMVIVSK